MVILARMRTLALLTCLLLSAPAWACDKIQRTVDFLGWTEGSAQYAWRVNETCVGCSPKWVTERVFVRSTGGNVTEYVTRWEKSAWPRPELPDAAAFAAWKKKFPLTTKGKAVPLSAKQGELALKPNAQKAFCAKKQGEMVLTAQNVNKAWDAPSPECGCARGFPSPAGDFVAWITGPARRVCDDCKGSGCCGEVEGFASRVE